MSGVNLVRLFLLFAFMLGVSGGSIGMIGGWWFLAKINRIEDWLFESFGFQLWNRAIYAIGDIPNQVEFKVLAVIMASAIAACVLGAVVPIWQAARLKPVETLQVNQI